tara:strand:- start:1789 stop:2346 length:558 start_codon:yes stop_codon:yes gene_type:complete
MIESFVKELNNNNFTSYITGGYCYRKYFNLDEETCDYDIHIFISYKQLNDKESFRKIYNFIKVLYKNLEKKYELLPLSKFDYANYSRKYIEDKLLNRQTEFYLHSIIADIQIEDLDNTYVDISIQVTPDIKKIKENIEEDYYLSKKYFIKEINNFYEHLLCADNKDKEKIKKIKNRIKIIDLLEK